MQDEQEKHSKNSPEQEKINIDNLEGITIQRQKDPHQFISIHQELLILYAKLFDLNLDYTYTNSTDNSNIISSLPIVYYGINIIKRYNLNYFLKSLTNIDSYSTFLNGTKQKQQEIENLILTDLQLILSVCNYLYRKQSRSYISKLFDFIYNPRESISTFLNDKKLMQEFNQIYHVNSWKTLGERLIELVNDFNDKIESFIEELGGNSYCRAFAKREVNSVDLIVYAMYKAEMKAFNHDGKSRLRFNLIKELSNEIEISMKNNFAIKHKTILRNSERIIHKVDYGMNNNFSLYKDVDSEKVTLIKNRIIKKLFFIGGFFALLVYLKVKKFE